MGIDGFVLEEDDVAHLRNKSLIFPGHGESPPCVFLFPEGMVEVENNSPPGDLVLCGDVWVDFVSVTLSEAEEYIIGGESDPQWSCQDERPVVEFVDNHVDPGEEFFVIHPELMRA